MLLSHEYIHNPAGSKRSPCPALNALANHGYINRSGTDITFSSLVAAMREVYNLSLPLALVLALAGFVTCGQLSSTTVSCALFFPIHFTRLALSVLPFPFSFPRPAFPLTPRLDLSDLAQRGPHKIAHDGALVHPNYIPSHAPDPALVHALVGYADGKPGGMSVRDLARYHNIRMRSVVREPGMSALHTQITLGECALVWEVLKARDDGTERIPAWCLAQWFGEERLPDGWWDAQRGSAGVRPEHEIGLLRAQATANFIGMLAASD